MVNFKKLIKDSSISVAITFLIFLSIELFILFILGYKSFISGNKNCKILNEEKNFSTYKPNCKLTEKHWENDYKVEYFFNSFGRRDGELNIIGSDNISIASIGDSFTFGAMVSINENYNYYGFMNLNNNRYAIHNYGVAGEQLDNIINKLIFKEEVFSQYDFVLYGLTPNDFFDYLEESIPNRKDSKSSLSGFKLIKSVLLSSGISRLILHNILSNESNYYSIYLKRKPYSGYLNSNLDENWVNALKIFESKISNLPDSIKSRLKIILLPQRAEVVGYKLGSYQGSFSDELIKSCEKIKVDCFVSNLEKLSLLKESHFPVDGHLTIEGNKIIGLDLTNWAKTWKAKKLNK